MTEFYHIHTKGYKDDKWKEKKEIIVNDNFVNKVGMRVRNFNDCTTNPQLTDIINQLNICFKLQGFNAFSKMPLYFILDFVLDQNNKIDARTQKIILKEVKNLAFNAAMLKRETAMENYRRDNNEKLPSRQRCIYATTEEGLLYWEQHIRDNDVEIFRIEAEKEPFKTSAIFIPEESGSYEEMYNNSYKYWNPKFKNISKEEELLNEYLISGKIKVLEKVAEIKKKQ